MATSFRIPHATLLEKHAFGVVEIYPTAVQKKARRRDRGDGRGAGRRARWCSAAYLCVADTTVDVATPASNAAKRASSWRVRRALSAGARKE